VRAISVVDYGFCECGCGEETSVSDVTDRSKGWVKGKPHRFRRGHAVLGRTISSGSVYSYHCLSELELGWVVGLLEGEGCFTIKKGKRKNGFSCTPAVRVVSTDGDVIDRLHELVPAGSVCKPTRKTKGGKQIYSWSLQNTEAVLDLLVVVFPMMGERRQNRIREVLAHPTFLRYEDVQ
jgi:hypothetical protein